MRALALLILFFGISSNASLNASLQVTECRVEKNTYPRNFFTDELILAGSLAVTRDAKNVTIADILNDEMFFLRDFRGKVSKGYQWMYNPLLPVENESNKYISYSYNEIVTVTVGEATDAPGTTSVRYVGTRSGPYLDLVCN